MTAKVTYELDVHEGKNVILIKFPYDKALVERVKKLVGVKWSRSKKAWYVSDTSQYREKFGLEEKVIGKEAILKIADINRPNFQRFVDLLHLKGYSTNTIRTYTVEFSQLLYLIKDKNVNELTAEQLKSYLLYCLQTLKLSENQVHNRINAIKFYFEKVLKQPTIVFDIPRPKKPFLLPKVIHIEDVAKMIKQTENIKHKTMLMLVYGMGLRVSEIVKLEITDIDSKNMQVHIRGAKGKKTDMLICRQPYCLS